MPLFHIHGLIAALLVLARRRRQRRLHAGLPRASSSRVDRGVRPTWYTAVPTIHQAMLQLRAPSAAKGRVLPPPSVSCARRRRRCRRVLAQTRGGLRRPGDRGVRHDRGRAPDGEQSAPPGRKPGTVGQPAGPESWCSTTTATRPRYGRDGRDRHQGSDGDAGYVDNPRPTPARSPTAGSAPATRALDEDGYLTITGRLKEIINRGGEKVAPREVDDRVLEHLTCEAAVFAMPHSAGRGRRRGGRAP